MKGKLILAAISAVMFAVSLVGFLAVQGRLNYAGTRGIPVVSSLFHAPADTEAEKGHKDEGKKDGKEDKKDEGRKDEGKKEPDHEKKAEVPPAGDKESSVAPEKPPVVPQAEHRDVKGGLFQFPTIQSSITAEELTSAIVNLEARRKDLERREALVGREKEEILALARDLEERRKAIRADMAAVQSAAEEVDGKAKGLRDETSLLKQQEQKNYKDQAERFASMEPKKAADLLLEMGPEGEDRVVKLLATMDAETAAKILGEMDAKRGARIVERSLKLVREPARPDGK